MSQYNKSDHIYTALFCEENIWHLAYSLINSGINQEDIKILFITNKNQSIAVFNQLASRNNQPVLWDYHVILMALINKSSVIFDLDSRLPFPCDFKNYMHKSLSLIIEKEYLPIIRIIPAELYLNHLHSDRSHMKNIISNDQFPSYPPLLSATEHKISLTTLLDVKKTIKGTQIISGIDELINWVATQ